MREGGEKKPRLEEEKTSRQRGTKRLSLGTRRGFGVEKDHREEAIVIDRVRRGMFRCVQPHPAVVEVLSCRKIGRKLRCKN